jgi:integrase
MAARPRSRGNKDLPANLYTTRTGYEYRHPITKKRHGMGSDRRRAIEAAKILNLRFASSVDLVARVTGERTVADIISRFRQEYLADRDLAERTRSETEYRLRRYERELGSRSWASFDLAALTDWLRPLTRDAYIKHRGQWIDIYRFACSVGAAERNLAEMTLPKAPGERKRKRWTLEQFKAARALAEPWLRIAMDLAVLTLQRREDLVNMRFEDIQDGRLLVRQNKTGKRLAIKLGGEASATLATARARTYVCPFIIARKPLRLRKGQKQHSFQVTASFLTKAVAAVRDETGLFESYEDGERPTLHELRSLGAHLYREAGFAEEYIQGLLGHSKPEMTRHYLDGHKLEWDEVAADLALELK